MSSSARTKDASYRTVAPARSGSKLPSATSAPASGIRRPSSRSSVSCWAGAPTGRSGRSSKEDVPDQPRLKACLAALSAGDVLIVTTGDRLAHSVDKLLAIEGGLHKRGVGPVLLSFNGALVDFRTDEAKSVLDRLNEIARWEYHGLRDRQLAGIEGEAGRPLQGRKAVVPAVDVKRRLQAGGRRLWWRVSLMWPGRRSTGCRATRLLPLLASSWLTTLSAPPSAGLCRVQASTPWRTARLRGDGRPRPGQPSAGQW